MAAYINKKSIKSRYNIMIRNAIEAIVALLVYIWANTMASDELRPELIGIAIGFTISFLIGVVFFLYNERNNLSLYWNSLIRKPNSEIRLSLAYIFRIECQGRYLLVKNKRFDTPTYQPVGGVYKYFNPEASSELIQMTIITDTSMGNDSNSEHDLRLKMKKRKYLRQFLKWFSSHKQREIDPWREFQEELISTGILPKKHFGYIHYNLLAQHFEPIHCDQEFKVDTYKYVDVYSPRFITEAQRKEIDKLFSKQSEEFMWVTPDEIQKKRSKDGKRIADHTHKIFFTKTLT